MKPFCDQLNIIELKNILFKEATNLYKRAKEKQEVKDYVYWRIRKNGLFRYFYWPLNATDRKANISSTATLL